MDGGRLCRDYRTHPCFSNTTLSKYIFITIVDVITIQCCLQGYTGKLSAKYRKETALKTDERVRLIDEVIAGVQVIKMYVWEIPFGNLIKRVRNLELKIIMKSSHIRGLYMTFNIFTIRVSLYCTLLTMALSGQQITATKVKYLILE